MLLEKIVDLLKKEILSFQIFFDLLKKGDSFISNVLIYLKKEILFQFNFFTFGFGAIVGLWLLALML